ncbi:MAG: DNA-binding domain-containing protein [Verrucomicrobiota bacterium]
MIAFKDSFQNDGTCSYTSQQLESILQKKGLLKELESYDGNLAQFAHEHGMNVSTVWRYRERAKLGSEALMDRRTRRRLGKSHVSNQVMEFVFGFKASHLKASNANIYRALEETAKKEGWRVPSYSQICRLVRATPRDMQILLEDGARASFEKWGLVARRENNFPNELWQLDATELDLWVIDTASGELYRPWMSSVIDGFSRVVLACEITRHSPTSADSIRLLMKAILPKNDERHPFFGIPKLLQRDNHQIYRSTDFLDALARLNISLHEIPNQCPSSNGKIERFFGTFKDQLLTSLIGYAGQENALALAKKNAIPDKLLPRLVDKFLLQYHLRSHAGIRGETPWERWCENVQTAHGLVMNFDDVRNACMVRRELTLQRDGFEVESGRHFSSPKLAGYVGEKFVLRLPITGRVEEAEVYYKGELFCRVKCVEEDRSLADAINSGRLARTIELQEIRKELRERHQQKFEPQIPAPEETLSSKMVETGIKVPNLKTEKEL